VTPSHIAGTPPATLRGASNNPQGILNLPRVISIRCVGRQHVVVSRDNADVGATHQLDNGFVVAGTGRHPMSQIAAAKLAAIHRLGRHRIDVSPILISQRSATSGDILGHAVDVWMHSVSVSCFM
jgi:hypothetical protein